MSKTVVSKVSKWAKLARILKRREFWIGVAGLALTVGIILAILFYWEEIQALGGYGYLGAFLIGFEGGATYIVSVPEAPIVFVFGTVLKPSFAPYLGPVFVGAATGLGEAIGELTVYMTGYGGGAALASSKHRKIQAVYSRLLHWMERRGSLVLFIFSALPSFFFYPLGLTAGALHFGAKRYFLICWAGDTIKDIMIAAAGYWGLGAILRAWGVPI